jgi:hypothetical protein
MSTKPKITTHYSDGTPSETREMTEEEYAQYEKDIADYVRLVLPDAE